MLLLLFSVSTVLGSIYTPEQVHIAWSDSETSMSVTWASQAPTPSSSVEFTPIPSPSEVVNSYLYSSAGSWTSFPNKVLPSVLQRHLHVCKALMINLVPGGYYAYRVGSTSYGWSQQFNFQAKRNFTDNEVARFLVYGDLSAGPQMTETILRLLQEVHTHQYDAIIHNGDFAYNLDSNSGQTGDSFMNSIELVASRLPYMVSQGNHESGQTLGHYINRFQMPGNVDNLWYSFNAGRAHFIAYNSEPIFDNLDDVQIRMTEFIERDLRALDREEYPWVIVYGHRPLYCSANRTDSVEQPPHFRTNSNCLEEADNMKLFFEDLWYDHGVDIVIASHVHAYERLGPVYKNQSMPCEEQSQNLCINAKAPIFIVTGVPGNDESYAPDSPTPLPFSWAQDDHLGFSRLTIFNDTHILWEEVRSLTFDVSDFLWLIKDNHIALDK